MIDLRRDGWPLGADSWAGKIIGVDEFPFRDYLDWHDGAVARCPWTTMRDRQPGITRADRRNARMHAQAMRRCAWAAALRARGLKYREIGEDLGVGARRAAELVKRWHEYERTGSSDVMRRQAKRQEFAWL